MNTPYTEIVNQNVVYRTFSKDVDESELVWHRDRENRLVQALNKNDWKVQIDNELPVTLDKVFIPKGVYHRIIKGSQDVTVKITKS